uniref:Uncharacterized protein n=1 Tax=Anguilla anguilla TaxID=7936 RepID=A0A0E9UMU1_ANGAN
MYCILRTHICVKCSALARRPQVLPAETGSRRR